jgi:deoxyguanosine kinase
MHKFIAVEGADGSGKTSIAKILADKLGGSYYHNPPERIEYLRSFANESPGFLRYHYFLLGNCIASEEFKEILKVNPLIADKYIYTTAAFHSAILKRPLDPIEGLLSPDWIIYAHADWDVVESRLAARPSRSKYEEIGFLKEVGREYDRILGNLPNVIRLDTTHKSAEEAVEEFLSRASLT